MKSELYPTNAGEIEFTLEVTLPLEDWEKLKSQLTEKSMSYPANQFIRQIRDMIVKANEHWVEEDE
jgi:hypothetical protein